MAEFQLPSPPSAKCWGSRCVLPHLPPSDTSLFFPLEVRNVWRDPLVLPSFPSFTQTDALTLLMLGARFCFLGRIQGGGIKPSPTLLKHDPSRLTSEQNSSETLQVFVHSRTEAAVHGTGLVSVFIISPGRCLVLCFLMICHFVHGIMDCKGENTVFGLR